jgi:phosphate transport system substrate-binding protein
MKKIQKRSQTFALSLLAAASLLMTNMVQAQTGAVVKVDGSSTVFPLTEAVAEEFQNSTKGQTKVTVGVSGTGGGFKKFCRGETDVSNASRPISKTEMQACAAAKIKFIELPVAIDALTVVVNPKNKAISQLTIPQLNKMWAAASQGTVNNWKDVDPSFPDQKLKLYGPGSDSGTFDYFTEAVNGKAKSSRGDYTASEDDNVLVQGISRDVNAIGYFGYAYYIENQKKLKAVSIVNKQGKAVAPNEATIISNAYNPLSRPIFIYVSEAGLNKPHVKQFVEFYLKNAAAMAREVKMSPLPAKAYTLANKHLVDKKFGTAFGDAASEIGLSIEQIMQKEAKF